MKTLLNRYKFVLLSVQLIVVFVLFILIYVIKSKDAGSVLSVIDKDTIQFKPSQNLKYFYEPKADTTEEVNHTWLSYPPKYTINSDSFNERYEYSLSPSEGTYRIITLGNSFTFGLNVDTKDNWPEKLEDMLNRSDCKNYDRFEVINLGVGGYDVAYDVERYKLRGVKYNPNLIIWFLFDQDFLRVNEYLKPIIDSYVDQFRENKDDTVFINGKFNELIDEINQEFEEKYTENQILKYSADALFNINKYYDRDVLFVTFPFTSDKVKLILHDFVAERSDSFINDSLDSLSDANDKLPDGHPSVQGHMKLAENILSYLNENRIIDCVED